MIITKIYNNFYCTTLTYEIYRNWKFVKNNVLFVILIGCVKFVTWVTFSLSVVGFLVFTLISLITEYRYYEYSMSITVNSAAQLTFPAVTICNLCPVRMSRWNAMLKNKAIMSQTHSAKTAQLSSVGLGFQALSSSQANFTATSSVPVKLRRRRRSGKQCLY